MTRRLQPTSAALVALLLGPVIALALLAVVYTTMFAPANAPADIQPVNAEESTGAADATIPATAAAPDQVARPARIEVPAIDVDAELVPLGLHDDGAMEVPDNGLAGWYKPGPRPGAAGPAVIAAHVDSRSGPDVFFRLRELEPGDEITVTDRKDVQHTFVVVDTEQADKDALPVERIWDDRGAAVLRLITCGGSFDRSSGHYRDNVIVYAERAA